jgi:hypothetical protein
LGVDDRFLNQGLEATGAESVPEIPLTRSFRMLLCGSHHHGRGLRAYAATWRRKVSDQPWGRELADQPLRVGGAPEQDVLEIFERRDADEATALHERIEEVGTARPLKAAGKHPVLLAMAVLP